MGAAHVYGDAGLEWEGSDRFTRNKIPRQMVLLVHASILNCFLLVEEEVHGEAHGRIKDGKGEVGCRGQTGAVSGSF